MWALIKEWDFPSGYGNHAWISDSHLSYITISTWEGNMYLSISIEIGCQILPIANYTTTFLIMKVVSFGNGNRNLFITVGQESTFSILGQFSHYCLVVVIMNQVKKWKEKQDAIITLTSYLLQTRHSCWRIFLCFNWAFHDKLHFSRNTSQFVSISYINNKLYL